MSDNDRIDAIRSELLAEGYRLHGPHQPGASQDGWFAPIIPIGSRGGTAPYGWGDTPTEAAEAALRIFRGG
jgi:hypothetical protein